MAEIPGLTGGIYEAWGRLQQTATQVAWPDKPSNKGASPQPDHAVRLKKLSVASRILELAENEVERCYTSLFWGRIYDIEFKENLQYIGVVKCIPPIGGRNYGKSFNFTREKHSGKGVYLLPLGGVANLGKIWIVVIGDPINNHFVTNCEAEEDFDQLLPKDFKGFNRHNAFYVAGALTQEHQHQNRF